MLISLNFFLYLPLVVVIYYPRHYGLKCLAPIGLSPLQLKLLLLLIDEFYHQVWVYTISNPTANTFET